MWTFIHAYMVMLLPEREKETHKQCQVLEKEQESEMGKEKRVRRMHRYLIEPYTKVTRSVYMSVCVCVYIAYNATRLCV